MRDDARVSDLNVKEGIVNKTQHGTLDRLGGDLPKGRGNFTCGVRRQHVLRVQLGSDFSPDLGEHEGTNQIGKRVAWSRARTSGGQRIRTMHLEPRGLKMKRDSLQRDVRDTSLLKDGGPGQHVGKRVNHLWTKI